jgi:hypothetical protein
VRAATAAGWTPTLARVTLIPAPLLLLLLVPLLPLPPLLLPELLPPLELPASGLLLPLHAAKAKRERERTAVRLIIGMSPEAWVKGGCYRNRSLRPTASTS